MIMNEQGVCTNVAEVSSVQEVLGSHEVNADVKMDRNQNRTYSISTHPLHTDLNIIEESNKKTTVVAVGQVRPERGRCWIMRERRKSRWSPTCHHYFIFAAQQPNSGLGPLFFEVARSHTIRHTYRTRQDSSVRVTCTSKRQLPTQHTTKTRDEYQFPQRDSNTRSQQSSGRRPTPQTSRPLYLLQ